jgi:hypothetical protein
VLESCTTREPNALKGLTVSNEANGDFTGGEGGDGDDDLPQAFLLGPCLPATSLYGTAVNNLAISILHSDNVSDAVSTFVRLHCRK